MIRKKKQFLKRGCIKIVFKHTVRKPSAKNIYNNLTINYNNIYSKNNFIMF